MIDDDEQMSYLAMKHEPQYETCSSVDNLSNHYFSNVPLYLAHFNISLSKNLTKFSIVNYFIDYTSAFWMSV